MVFYHSQENYGDKYGTNYRKLQILCGIITEMN